MAELKRWLAELRAADVRLGALRMDADAARRVARRIAVSQRARKGWWRPYVPAVCFAAGALLVLVVLGSQARGRLAAELPGDRSQAELSSPPSCEGEAIAPAQPIASPPAEPPRAAVVSPPAATPSVVVPLPPAQPKRRRGAAADRPRVPAASTGAVPPPTIDPIEALLAELRALRRAGRYAEAERRLEHALAGTWPTRAREVLHYELGTIVERHTGDRERACTLWREHLQRFPKTRYAAAIADARRRLACE